MTANSLRAVTVPLEEAPDLLREAGDHGLLWREEGGGLAGSGVAAKVTMPDGLGAAGSARQVEEMLQSIEVRDEVGLPGTGPVVFGALPFDPAGPGSLTIPARVVGRWGDKGWVTTISGTIVTPPPEIPDPPGYEGAPGDTPPDQFTLVSSMSQSEWMSIVADAVKSLTRGDLEKVVLARRIDISANRAFLVSDALERLQALYPSCMVFSVNGFIGASPELLIRRIGPRVESHPLAGTVARSGDAHGDEALVSKLMSSAKARHEHAVVVDALTEALQKVCDELEVPGSPSVLGLRNVSHLATHITGRLSGAGDEGASLPSALELVARVHPTPAVGGVPTEDAIRYLQSVEGFDRGCYTGPVGWMDARGDGAWAIGIRCAEIDGRRARIYAGNGIVSGSDPAEELAETQLKLQALLAALVRP